VKRLSILVLTISGILAQAQAIPPGNYIRIGGDSTLTVASNNTFSINTLGRNGHTCDVSGVIQGLTGTSDEGACVIDFKSQGKRLSVDTKTVDECKYFCGANAGILGLYIKPSLSCTDIAIARSRKSFKNFYDRKDFATAVKTLEPLLARCEPLIHWMQLGWIRNDLALAQHKEGNNSACLQTLKSLSADAAKTDVEIREEYPPIDADIYLPILKATRTNLKLCKTVR